MHYAAAVDGFLDYIERNKWALLGHICIIFVLSIWTLNGPTKSSRPASRKVSTTAQKQKTSQQLPAVMSGFAPKTEVKLDPPKDDPMSVEELAKYDGKTEGRPIYVAIKGELHLPMPRPTPSDVKSRIEGLSLMCLRRRKCMDRVQDTLSVLRLSAQSFFLG